MYIGISSAIASIPYLVTPSISPAQVFPTVALAAFIGMILVFLLAPYVKRVVPKGKIQLIAPMEQRVSPLDLEVARKMKRTVDLFESMIGTSDIAIKNIALDLLKSEGVDELLGKGVAGWRTFFEDYGGYASESFNNVACNLTKFIQQEPLSEIRLQRLAIDFQVALSNNYTCLDRFHRMFEDIGAKNIPINIEERYKLYRVKYDLFISKMLDIVDDVDKQGSHLRGTVLLNLTEELEQRHRFVLPHRYS